MDAACGVELRRQRGCGACSLVVHRCVAPRGLNDGRSRRVYHYILKSKHKESLVPGTWRSRDSFRG